MILFPLSLHGDELGRRGGTCVFSLPGPHDTLGRRKQLPVLGRCVGWSLRGGGGGGALRQVSFLVFSSRERVGREERLHLERPKGGR